MLLVASVLLGSLEVVVGKKMEWGGAEGVLYTAGWIELWALAEGGM